MIENRHHIYMIYLLLGFAAEAPLIGICSSSGSSKGKGFGIQNIIIAVDNGGY